MASPARVPPKGVFVPSPTFFQPPPADGSPAAVDVAAQVAHSVFLARAGITGIVLLGSTGEAIHLTRDERVALVAGVREGVGAGYPLMAGVLTSGGLADTLEWLADVAAAGADWGLVLAPGYFGTAASQSSLASWYARVADASPIPILVYNYPGVTNQVLVLPETYPTLAAHPNIVGCKMSHGNVSHHVQVSLDPAIDHDRFRVYSGFGQQLGPIVLFGAAGVIDGMAAFFPKTVVRLMALALALAAADDSTAASGSAAEIRRLQFVVSRAEEFVVRYGLIGIKEAVFRVTGIGAFDTGRLPIVGKLPDGEWDKARGLFLSEIEKTEASL